MSPRRYHLGKRADSVAETRRQILNGATAAFVDFGVRGTSMQEVARRADVAPATVLNHFGTPDDLVRAVVDNIIEELAIPETSIFDEVSDEMERVRILIDGMYDFYERSDRWHAMFSRERDFVHAFQDGEKVVHESISNLIVNALGDTSDDADLVAVVTAAVHPDFRQAILDVSGSLPVAKARTHELVESWYQTHRRS